MDAAMLRLEAELTSAGLPCDAAGQRARRDMIVREIGDRLRQARQERGLPMRALAEHVGISIHQISKYESGRDVMAAGTLYRLATAMDMTVGEMQRGMEGDASVPASAEGSDLAWGFGTRREERQALVRNFMRIPDPELRRLLVAAIRRMARSDED